jgi:Queuosine salvage protein
MSLDVFARIRDACARVAACARFVRIDALRTEAFARELAQEPASSGPADPAHGGFDDPELTLAFVITLDAINFGSGWFPALAKRSGASGYHSIASALEARFAAAGAWSAAVLETLTARDCALCFGQDPREPEVMELMSWYARALNDLGRYLNAGHAGRFAGPIEVARGRAARLVAELTAMPLYRDISHYGALEVPFYKRAQITASDLASAFGGNGYGHFEDLDALTLFADNLVPHVLRCEGVLHYAPELARRIDAGCLLASGCTEEVEIRAVAVHAVEACAAALRSAGWPLAVYQLDALLWRRGQRPAYKARPRHRTRCSFY